MYIEPSVHVCVSVITSYPESEYIVYSDTALEVYSYIPSMCIVEQRFHLLFHGKYSYFNQSIN